MIYLARVITRARYIGNGIVWYISLELLLERDISEMGLFDISRSSNYSSEIYWKWIWSIYLARVITWARYIEKCIWLIYRGCSGKCWKYGTRNCTNTYDKNAYLLMVWNLFLHHRILVLHLLLWDLEPLCDHRSLLVRLTKPSTFFFVKELLHLDFCLALFRKLP